MAQRLVPGEGYIDESGTASQRLVPGGGYYDEAATAGAYTLTAASGSFTLSGKAAILAFNRAVTAANGTFTLTGNAVNFVHTYTLTAASGSFALTGNAAVLAFNRRLTAASGSFTLTGNAANLTYTPAGTTYSLACGNGSFALTGNAAALTWFHAYSMTAGSGSFYLDGQAASLKYTPIGADVVGGGFVKKRTRYDYLNPPTREKLADLARKQREAMGILPKPVQKVIESAVKKEARKADPEIASLAPVAAKVAQESSIPAADVISAIQRAFEHQRALVEARFLADLERRRQEEAIAAEQARIEQQAAEEAWAQHITKLQAEDEALLSAAEQERQQAIALIRQTQKMLLALLAP